MYIQRELWLCKCGKEHVTEVMIKPLRFNYHLISLRLIALNEGEASLLIVFEYCRTAYTISLHEHFGCPKLNWSGGTATIVIILELGASFTLTWMIFH